MGGVLKAKGKKQKTKILAASIFAFCFLLFAFLSCTMSRTENGTIYTARAVVIGAAQAPSHGMGVLVRDGKILAVYALTSLRPASPSAVCLRFAPAPVDEGGR